MKMFTQNLTLTLGVIMAIVACSQTKEKTEESEDISAPIAIEGNSEPAKIINTNLMSSSGSELKGEATFMEAESGNIDLIVKLNGVAPGQHAVHIHEKGDCSAADASSAGGHWNPMNVDHGHRFEDDEFHKGDIGNITIGNDSTGVLDMEIAGWTIGGDSTTNILNKAVIVHAGPDDFSSQPSGAAGARIGCGVIKK